MTTISMNLPHSTVLDDLRTIALRFWAVAGLGALITLGFGWETQWTPFLSNNDSLQGTGWGTGVGDVTVALLAAVPLLALRLPVLAGLLALVPLVATVYDQEHTWPFTIFLALLGAAMVAMWRSATTALALGAAALMLILTNLLGWTVIDLPYGFEIDASGSAGERSITFGLFLVAVALSLGAALALRSTYLSAQRATRLEARATDVERESSVVSERARLAHDLHDVVAHHVSLIAVRAETAPYTVPDLSPDGLALMSAIADDSRRALDELRGVLGVLRRSDGSMDDLAPQPGAGDIERLVQECRIAGSRIRLEVVDLDGVPPPVGYVAYRVVQEALTNARRHAPGAEIDVMVRGTGDGTTIRVANAAPGAAIEPGGGLTGMRERVEALGGSLAVTHDGTEVVVEASL